MIIKGKILSIKYREWGSIEILLRQSKKDNYMPICLTGFSSFAPKIKELELQIGDLIKINYRIYSKEHNDKYYTTLFIDSLKLLEKSESNLFVDTETGEIIE